MNSVDKLQLLITYSVGKDLRSTSHPPPPLSWKGPE